MFKKVIFLLIITGTVTIACSGQSADNKPPEPSAITLRDFGMVPELLTIHDFHRLQILSWRFARAALSDDVDTMRALMVPDATFYSTWDIFDDLYYLILKGMHQSDGGIVISYELLINGEDSTYHVTIFMKQTRDGWKVLWSAFE